MEESPSGPNRHTFPLDSSSKVAQWSSDWDDSSTWASTSAAYVIPLSTLPWLSCFAHTQSRFRFSIAWRKRALKQYDVVALTSGVPAPVLFIDIWADPLRSPLLVGRAFAWPLLRPLPPLGKSVHPFASLSCRWLIVTIRTVGLSWRTLSRVLHGKACGSKQCDRGKLWSGAV